MNTPYALHNDDTNDASRHTEEITRLTDRMEVPEEKGLHGQVCYAGYAPLRLHLKDDVSLPESPEAYATWEAEIKLKLGEALGQYGLVVNECYAGDGTDQSIRSIYKSTSTEECRRLEWEELQNTHTLTFSVRTKELDANMKASDSTRAAEKQQARDDLAAFIKHVECDKTAKAGQKLTVAQGVIQYRQQKEARANLPESLYHFDDVGILDAPDSNLASINGAVTLEMTLSEAYWNILLDRPGVEASQKADSALGWLETNVPHRMKHLLGKDLGKYDLAPVTGRFNPATRTLTFTVTDKENYEALQSDGTLDYSKALGKGNPSEKTLKGVKRYLDDFARARELGLEKSQGRQR